MAEAVRLQKFLSQAGVASRRASEAMILSGQVAVNGKVVIELGTKVDPDADHVTVDGRDITPAPPEWIALHKPQGYLTTRHDPRGGRTVYDLLPERARGLFYVGRLDRDSEGLILFTNDGDAANNMLHPRNAVERIYQVEVGGSVPKRLADKLRKGVRLEDGMARAHKARVFDEQAGKTRVEVSLLEGRKREVRRMFDVAGYPVRRLLRTQYGPVELGDLPVGQWRALRQEEIEDILALTSQK
ncbi:MAG: pseudouridine synthase [Longimicrobiales bacterium]